MKKLKENSDSAIILTDNSTLNDNL